MIPVLQRRLPRNAASRSLFGYRNDIVNFIDQLVANGECGSRAVVVARAIDREQRREIAARHPRRV